MSSVLRSVRQVVTLNRSGFWGADNDAAAKGIEVAVVRNGDVRDDGSIAESLPRRVFTPEQVDKAGLSPGDVLLTSSGNTGRVTLIQNPATSNGIRTVGSNFVRILRPDTQQVLPAYLCYAMRTPKFKMLTEKHSRGVTIQNLSMDILDEPFLPLPTLREQGRIVELLDEGAELRKLRAQADRRTTELVPALYHEMFRSGGERATWSKATLADLCSVVVDCPHSTPTYTTAETRFACIRSSDIQEGKLDWSSTKYVDEAEYTKRIARLRPESGDVVFCREGARLGNAALVTGEQEVCLGQRMMLFRVAPSLATPEFVCSYLLSKETQTIIWNLVGGAASPHLNVGDAKQFLVAVPPIALQRAFAQRVGEIRELEAGQVTSRAHFDALFQSTLHGAFAGEL